MQKSLFQRILAVLLASLMLSGTVSMISVSAAGEEKTADTKAVETDENASEKDSSFRSMQEIKELIGARSYEEYSVLHENASKATETIKINAVDYDAESTTGDVQVVNNWEGVEGDSLYMPEGGSTSWKVTIPANAKYAMRITYYPVTEINGKSVTKYTTIERMLYIDGNLPFSEARYLYFPRVWKYQETEDGKFETDINGNDIRPIRSEAPRWETYYLRDWLGYTIAPFEFYFSAGEHVITFEGSREPVIISSIELYGYEEEPTYAEFIAEKKAQGVKEIENISGGVIKVQGEEPLYISNACLFPTNDRTSALTEPQDPAVIKLNFLNSTTVNQWMEYQVEVPETGLYTIAARFRQNDLIGMFTSRRIIINGEVQFREASHIRFKYSPGWQSAVLNDGTASFMFYLEKGVNTIRIEVVLGDMTEYVTRIDSLIEQLNNAYTKILMLTGPTPDYYRDYGFNRLVPEAIDSIGNAAEELYKIADELEAITGELGDQVATLNTIGLLFETMADDEYEIAPNFVAFKNYIVALSNWLYASLNQPLKLDFFTIQGSKDKLPRAKVNFFQGIWFEILAFIKSFTMDYTTIGYKNDVVYDEKKTVELWVASATTSTGLDGRDGALVTRYLADNYFTPESGISVTIKVITAGLTEAILAGIGPDIANMSSVDTITWGLRNAVEPLNDMKGFDEAMTWFDDAVIMPLTMTNAEGKTYTYGMPTTMTFYMMFYRADVLAELDLEAPKTWQELYDMLPVLQNKNLEVGLPIGLEGTKLFLYQTGGELYADNGRKIGLDQNVALDAFEELCNMFTKYKCQVSYDITRFRTGEIPIIIADAISTYNTLMSYYELRGLWEMAPLLGHESEEGTINRTTTVNVSALVIPRGATNPEASWEYIKWYVSTDTQKKLARETLAVSANPTTKYATPNKEAMLSLAWTGSELEAISTQLDNLAGIPEYPGNYIISTYVDSAFYAAYNKSSDASEELLDRIIYINKEISRKRKEFGMDYLEISDNGSFINDETGN